MWRGITLLVVLMLVTKVSVRKYDDYKIKLQVENDNTPQSEPYFSKDSDEQYIRHINSMYDAYRRGPIGSQLVIDANVLAGTKYYRPGKRNADLINSLLALPKGMNEAGR